MEAFPLPTYAENEVLKKSTTLLKFQSNMDERRTKSFDQC